jgi:hypothetical protein
MWRCMQGGGGGGFMLPPPRQQETPSLFTHTPLHTPWNIFSLSFIGLNVPAKNPCISMYA